MLDLYFFMLKRALVPVRNCVTMAPVYLISTALEAITVIVMRIHMERTVKNVSRTHSTA